MLRCREVARLLASEEWEGAGWRRRLVLELHLAMCRHCRRYREQLRELGRAVREIWPLGVEDEASIRRLEAVIARQIGDRPGRSAR